MTPAGGEPICRHCGKQAKLTHGEPCTKAYLKEQGQIVENWIGYIERFVERGLSPEEILK